MNLLDFFGLGESPKFDFNLAKSTEGFTLNDYNDLYGADGLSKFAENLGRNPETGELLDQSGFLTNADGSFNFDQLGQALGAFQSLGQLYLGKEQLDLARDAFNSQRQIDTANINNQVAAIRSNANDRNAARTRRARANGISNPDLIDTSGFTTLGG